MASRAKRVNKSVKRVDKATRLAKKPRKKRSYQYAAISQPTWQNPFIEYMDAARRRKKKARPKPPKRVKLERQILAMLACFSISAGIWENFRQLWLQQNGFEAPEVSALLSMALVAGIVGVVIVGKLVKMPQIKNLITIVLLVSSINLLFLHFLNGTGSTLLIGFAATVDVVTSALIVTSVYPLLTTVMKSNRAYSRRKLVEYIFRDIGILIGGILIGRSLGYLLIDYNAILLVAVLFSMAACTIVYRMDLVITERAPESKFSVVKYILKNKIQRAYMVYAFLAGTAYYTVIGLKMLVLTDYFGLSASMGTNYLLIVGLSADALGVLALRYFTPKNDYVTLLIKFGVRVLIFTGAFLSGDPFLCFVALTWVIISSTAYENITDGYYINAVDNRHQLKYNTAKYMVGTSGEALGMFLCGQMFQLGLKYIFGLSAVIIVAQLAVGFYLIRLRHQQRKKRG